APTSHTFITGPSGSGKSTLLRVIAGLELPTSGTILKPSDTEMMFLPQRAYMIPRASLHSQIHYPSNDRMRPDLITEALQMAEVDYLEDRALQHQDGESDWTTALSGGERQRIALARVFLRRPKYAFLDEASCNLDFGMEVRIFR
ncbi:hypothetical protein HK097_006562, partial [Rhizophlyctis rosea]